MPRRGKRKRLDRCIYEDRTGPSIVVAGREYRKGLHGLTLQQLRAERARLEGKRAGSGRIGAARGTLAAAVDEWDDLERHLASYVSRRAELRAWARELGYLAIGRITDKDVRRIMGKWLAAGLAPKTMRNRLWSLGHLYRVVLGAHVETPVDGIEPPAKLRTVITPVSAETILAVYHRLIEFEQDQRPAKKGENRTILRDAKTRARYMVRASTGRRPSEIMRAEPDDVDLSNRVWRVRDGKGGWSEGLYLNDDMLIAWMTFAQAKAWGDFNTGSMAEVLRRAGWPSERDRNGRYLSRPYHLRHTIGMAISEDGVDLADVGGWLGHRHLQTTRSIYAPIINSRMRRISEGLAGRLSGWGAKAGAKNDAEIRGDSRDSSEEPDISATAESAHK